MRIRNNIFFYSILIVFALVLTIFASACSCGEKYKEIQVIVNNQQITTEYNTVNIPADTEFSITKNVQVYGINQNNTKELLVLENGDYEISINPLLTNPLSAGSYEITIKSDNKEIKIPLVIRNSDDIITVQQNNTKTYDGLPASEPIYTTKSGNEATITWFTANKQEQLNQSPTNAGSYVCELKTASNNSFTGTTTDVPFEILKANYNSSELNHRALACIYDANTTLANFDLDEFYTWKTPSITPTCDVTEYKAIYNADSTNYNDCEVNITITVSQAKVPEPEECLDTFVYNAQPQTYTITSSSLYSVSDNVQTNVRLNHNGEVIPHTVIVRLNDKTNYIWETAQNTQDLTFDFTINKADPIVEPLEYMVEVGTMSENIEFPTQFVWSNDANYEIPTQFASVGTYNLKATFTPEDTNNYNVIDVDVTISVNEVINIPTMLANETRVYNRHEQEAPLDYTTFDDQKMTIIEGLAYTNAGNYSLIVEPKANYMWQDNTKEQKQIAWSIEKAPISLSAKDYGNYSSDTLKSEYDANHFATDEVIVNNLTTLSNNSSDWPFTIIENSLPLTDEINTFNFRYVANSQYTLNNGLILFSNTSLQSPTATIGSAYVCVTYELVDNNNYILNTNNTCSLIYRVSIVPQQYKVTGSLGIDCSNYDNTLGSIAIDSSNVLVFVYLADEPNSTNLTQTAISGSWTWADDASTIVNPLDTVTATFTPATANANYTGAVEQNVLLNISPISNITYTMANGEQVNSIEDVISLPCFLTDIDVCLYSNTLQVQITNYGENSLTLGAIYNAEQKYVVTILNSNDDVLETKTITIQYSIDVYVERNSSTLTTLNTINTLSAVVTYGDLLDLFLDDESDLTLLLYTSNTYTTRLDYSQVNFANNQNSTQVYARIMYDETYYLDVTFSLQLTQ